PRRRSLPCPATGDPPSPDKRQARERRCPTPTPGLFRRGGPPAAPRRGRPSGRWRSPARERGGGGRGPAGDLSPAKARARERRGPLRRGPTRTYHRRIQPPEEPWGRRRDGGGPARDRAGAGAGRRRGGKTGFSSAFPFGEDDADLVPIGDHDEAPSRRGRREMR